jgi:hypothetical protein
MVKAEFSCDMPDENAHVEWHLQTPLAVGRVPGAYSWSIAPLNC